MESKIIKEIVNNINLQTQEFVNDLDSQITALQTKTSKLIEAKKNDKNIIELQTLQDLKEYFIKEQKEANLLNIFNRYLDNLKVFFELKINKTSIIDFEKINNTTLQEARQINFNENIYFKLLATYQNNIRQDLNAFFFSPLFSFICELHKDSSIKEAYISFWNIKQENYTDEEAIILLKRQLAEKQIAEFEADFLEKCSCYQNNIINNLLKIIGASINSKTNKIEEKGNRLYVSTEIKKGEIFKLSIDKDKEITPAMFKYYIYFLTIATQHIKPIYNNGNMQAMQFIIINLDEVSEELGIRKDNLKKIFKDMLEAFQTVNIEKATYFANGLKVVSKSKRYITINNAKIINGFKIHKNKIEVCLNEAFTVSLINSQEMIIPLLLFRVNQNQYPLSFIIGYFLLLHERRTQKERNYNDFIYLDIETILNNSCKDIDNITKQKHSTRDKGLFINNIQHLVNIGLLKEYKYKQNGVSYESNYIEDNATFTQWRKYTLAYKFTDKIINECLKPYNKPIPKKSKITK